MKKKTLFLFFALVLPVAVFLFLRIFGRNEFQVPVLHEKGDIQASADCPFTYSTPYHVPDSVFTRLGLDGRDSLYVFYFDPSVKTAMHRILVAFEGAPVRLVAPEVMAAHGDPEFFRRCMLLMEADTSVAVVDYRNRIRGYYLGSDRDEVDRLMVEMKIILKQY